MAGGGGGSGLETPCKDCMYDDEMGFATME
jgi:hypothetical protein